jgi:para-nitrobenzyl esterase
MRLASLLLLSALFVQQATGQTVQVVTPTGIIAGRSDGGVETFKGLPYAAPQVGAMRWRAPGDPKIWSGVRDGSQFGPVCVQRVPSY